MPNSVFSSSHFALTGVLTAGVAAMHLAWSLFTQAPAAGQPPGIAERLIKAYPGIVVSVNGNSVVFADGSALPLDDGKGAKPFAAWLTEPDIEDMFLQVYPAGDVTSPPPADFDPGRARNEAFFTKVYGDCRKGEVEKSLADVIWLPKKSGTKLKVSTINGAADRLEAVSRELDAMPSRFDANLFPVAGTYNCRTIAGTTSLSAHGLGIAIDIALAHSNYWRWEKPAADGSITYRNAIPLEIVRIFEKHGFIWGGKWHHFDTMHFEYRPELLMPAEEPASPADPPGR